MVLLVYLQTDEGLKLELEDIPALELLIGLISELVAVSQDVVRDMIVE